MTITADDVVSHRGPNLGVSDLEIQMIGITSPKLVKMARSYTDQAAQLIRAGAEPGAVTAMLIHLLADEVPAEAVLVMAASVIVGEATANDRVGQYL